MEFVDQTSSGVIFEQFKPFSQSPDDQTSSKSLSLQISLEHLSDSHLEAKICEISDSEQDQSFSTTVVSRKSRGRGGRTKRGSTSGRRSQRCVESLSSSDLSSSTPTSERIHRPVGRPRGKGRIDRSGMITSEGSDSTVIGAYLTRNAIKKVSLLAITGNISRVEEKSRRRIPLQTAIQVDQLPNIFERVMKTLPEQLRSAADIYQIQDLIVTCAMNHRKFHCSDADDRIFEQTIKEISENRKQFSSTSQDWHRQGKTSYWVDQQKVAEMIHKYDQLMAGDQMDRLRKYHAERHVWTQEQVDKFKFAFKKYGDGPTSNRAIAKYIGYGVHPNHVAQFKRQYKRQIRLDEIQASIDAEMFVDPESVLEDEHVRIDFDDEQQDSSSSDEQEDEEEEDKHDD